VKDIVKVFLFVMNIISFVLVAIFGLAGLVYEILGPSKFEKLLARLNIPWTFERVWNVSFICLVVLIVIYILRKKLNM